MGTILIHHFPNQNYKNNNQNHNNYINKENNKSQKVPGSINLDSTKGVHTLMCDFCIVLVRNLSRLPCLKERFCIKTVCTHHNSHFQSLGANNNTDNFT